MTMKKTSKNAHFTTELREGLAFFCSIIGSKNELIIKLMSTGDYSSGKIFHNEVSRRNHWPENGGGFLSG